MSWLRNTPLRSSFGPTSRQVVECDPTACIESFKKHWQQASNILESSQPPKNYPIHDDVLGVVNNLGQMITLLVIELGQTETQDSLVTPSPCLEHMLSENMLERLFHWGIHTGRFANAMKLEQFKLYELLVSRAGHHLLVHEPFLRPLLKLLTSCPGEVFPFDVEKRLVTLLNQLCVTLMQNVQLLDLFFYTSNNQDPAKFILFSLLIPYVHREGGIGQQARDALLLCMSMSKKNDLVGSYIAEHSNVCPVLATGLSGLYSRLPRKLEIETDDWHRLTPDDVTEVPELTLFMNSLEFCNAVAQVAHVTVKDQLLEFLYQGFLVPVMGPALLQDIISLPERSSSNIQLIASTVEELVAATAYYELFLRSATCQGLMHTLTKFLLCDVYDGQKILNTLVNRITSPTRLSLVTLSLLETLISLDSEEVMYELVFKHLLPCTHVMYSQRRRLIEIDPYTPSAIKFISLAPNCCIPKQSTTHQQLQPTKKPPNQHTHVYGLRPEESLYGNYHAYLCDARYKIEQCSKNCEKWTRPYDCGSENIVTNLNECTNNGAIEVCDKNEDVSLVSVGESSGYESFAIGKCSAETTPENEPSEPNSEDCVKTKEKYINKNGSNILERFNSTPDIGPFLDAVLKALEKMPIQSLYVNLRLTGIISRLAVYPQALLSSFLLNHSLVFQPSVRSLIQVLGSLKQKLDSNLNKIFGIDDMVSEARNFLLQREVKMANMRKTAVEASNFKRNNNNFERGEPKRRSFSSALTSVLRRAIAPQTQPMIEGEVEVDTTGTTYRYVRRSRGEINREEDIRNTVMCAVLLDEWLKELAAIAQEQTLFALS